ncbi:hypothetical protein BurJ1DRAFT_1835 [Burkholderiales bacterium JOSHI_001]|nr:hypothetical protein BurJ1DRAFT_1835 [Burkholderiales bacterium JOSHI_001]
MFAIRCTKKLLVRGNLVVNPAPSPTTTVLGDWYANVLITRPHHLVLCISEKTLLPVVVAAKDLKAFPLRLTEAVEIMLTRIGVPAHLVHAETREMSQSVFAKTESRKVLGSLNDFMFHLQDGCASDTSLSLGERAMQLANMPSGAIEFAFPSEQALSLFQARQAIEAAQSAA